MSIKSKLLSLLRIEPISDREELRRVAALAARAHWAVEAIELEKKTAISELNDSFVERHEEALGTFEEAIKRIRVYCLASRDALFGKRQSLVIDGHSLEFRLSPGKVETVDDRKEGDILEAILSGGDDELINNFVQAKPTLDKAAVLRHWKTPAMREKLERLGLRVVKPESFGFTPAHLEDSALPAAGKAETRDGKEEA